jgi:hypothetical protein
MERKERRGERERVPESKNERQRQQQQQQQQQQRSNSAAAATTAEQQQQLQLQQRRRRQQQQQPRQQQRHQPSSCNNGSSSSISSSNGGGPPSFFLSFSGFFFIYLASTSGGSRLVVYPPFPSCLYFPPIPFSFSLIAFYYLFTNLLFIFTMYLYHLVRRNPRVPKVPRVSWHTVRFTGRYVPAPATGTVYAGTGAVWENPTRGLPVSNPTGDHYQVLPLP